MTEQLKLKDYKKMELNRIYKFDNLFLSYDGEILLSHYTQEEFWYPFYETDKWFITWKDRDLTKTDNFY